MVPKFHTRARRGGTTGSRRDWTSGTCKARAARGGCVRKQLALLGRQPSLLDLGPAVPQGQRTVEHRLVCGRFRIHAEVALAQELEWISGARSGQSRLGAAAVEDDERLRVQRRGESARLDRRRRI